MHRWVLGEEGYPGLCARAEGGKSGGEAACGSVPASNLSHLLPLRMKREVVSLFSIANSQRGGNKPNVRQQVNG